MDLATDRSDLPDQPANLACCPFCGQPATLDRCLRHGFFVNCDNPHCAAQPETRDFDTEQQAAEAWNSRAPVGAPA